MRDADAPSPRRRRRGRIGLWMLVLPLLLAALAGIAALSVSGRPVVLPGWAAGQVEARLNAGLAGGRLELGRVTFEVDDGGVPRLVLRNVALADAGGASLGQLNEVRARFSPAALLRGGLAPTRLRVSGAQITVRRAADGAFTLSFGGTGAPAFGTMGGALDAIDAAFSAGALGGIERIEASDLTLTLEDARSGRVWQATDGRVTLTNTADAVTIAVVSEVFNGTEQLADVQLSFLSPKAGGGASLGVTMKNAAAADIALQAPALSYLGVLDAPVSGAMRAVLRPDGALESLAATLELGAGALKPTPAARAIDFNDGRVYLAYDPERSRIDFTELSVRSDVLRLTTTGHAYLRDFRGDWPETLIGQVRIGTLALAEEGLFDEAVVFDGGMADVRLRLDPFTVELGQGLLTAGEAEVLLSGTVDAGEAGWSAALDLFAEEITPEELLSLWPVGAVPNTRRWIAENVQAGRFRDVDGALRLAPGRPVRLGLTYDFSDARVRFMKHMPVISGGRGHAALIDERYSMWLEGGTVWPEEGGPILLAGSALEFTDLQDKVPRARIRLSTDSTLTAALSVMDNRPFEVLRKSDRPAGLAEARARMQADIAFDLLKDIEVEDVEFAVAGALEEVRSEAIVPGRVVTADRLSVALDGERLRLSGPVRLDGVPLEVVWRQGLAREEAGRSRLDGTVVLSAETLEAFGIGLPEGTVSGQGRGRFSLDIPREGPPDFTLGSDLAGLALALPSLGWSKPAGAEGELSLAGRLGPEPEIDTLRLAAPGLEAEGRIVLGEGGRFVEAAFDRVQLGGWLDAPVQLTARGEGLPAAVAIRGGTVDLRGDSGPGRTGGGGAPVPVELALDRLILTDELALAPFRASLTAQGGLNGRFEARVNGASAISGVMVPQRGRTAFRVTAADAGAAFRDARVFRSFDSGALEVILVPRAEGEGFDGQLTITDTRLRDQPVLADLLDAVSIVGIIDQLRGPGIAFDQVEARFRLLPDTLVLDRGSAVGASLGISLDGYYDLDAKRLDMQGVISPVYMFNAIGQIFTRQGEGLFGFTFRLRGDAEDPRVAVNPLSILTPGMFREIFRRPPPSAAGPGADAEAEAAE